MRIGREMSNMRFLLLRMASSLVVMCGWSLVLITLVGGLLGCGPLQQDGFTGMCGSLCPPTVYFYIGAVVIVFGTLLQAVISPRLSDFATLAFAGFCGGTCFCALAYMAQALYIPWAIALFMLGVFSLIIPFARRRAGETAGR